jgi:hypothetical protein
MRFAGAPPTRIHGWQIHRIKGLYSSVHCFYSWIHNPFGACIFSPYLYRKIPQEQHLNTMITFKPLRWIFVFAALIASAYPVWAQSSSTSVSISTDHDGDRGVHRWKTSTGTTSFNVELRGKIEITDDDKDIKGMSDDGYLEISKTVFGSKRTIIIESQGNGKLKKEYYEGRSQMDWDPAGKNWLGEILPEVIRSTTIGAESRVERFYKQGGANAVLDEIDKMTSDYVQSHYGKLLLSKNIPASELPSVINKLANAVNSDYYLSSLLKDNVGKLLATKESADAFFYGARKVGSDYYKSVLLKEALKKYAASSEMSSDYYMSVVLTTLLEQKEVKDESLTELLVISKKIPSAYYRTVVLNKAIEKPGLSKSALKAAVEAAGNVDSDYYQTSVYNSMAEHATIDDDVVIQIIEQIGNVDSDYYGSVSLKNLLEHQKLSEPAFNKLIVTASHIGSAHYATDVLKEAADKPLSKNQLITLLNACGNVDSDSYLANILLEVADQVRTSDETVKAAYRQAAKRIDSEHYYGRALKAIE